MNPSSRILKITTSALKINRSYSGKAITAWVQATPHLQALPEERQYSHASKYLIALEDQATKIPLLLKEKNVPDDIFQRHTKQLIRAFSVEYLTGPWATIQKLLTPEVDLTLNWASWVIDQLEQPIQEDDLNQLISALNELESLIAEPGLPESLRALIRKNTQEIWEALELYPIQGAASLQEAITNIAGSFMFNQVEIKKATESQDEATKNASSKFIKVVKKFTDTINYAINTGESAQKIADFFSNLPQLPG